MTSVDVRKRLVEIGVPDRFERMTGGPRPVSIPTGVPIWDQLVTDRLDEFIWTLIACQNAGAWSDISHATDNYLKTSYPTLGLDVFDEFVANNGTELDERRTDDQSELGFGGTFGWIQIDEHTVGGYFITGVLTEITPGFVTAHPEIQFVVLIGGEAGYLIDSVKVLGELGPSSL